MIFCKTGSKVGKISNGKVFEERRFKSTINIYGINA